MSSSSCSFRTVKTQAQLYTIGAKYKVFYSLCRIKTMRRMCKLKQSTVRSTGYRCDSPHMFYSN